MLGPVTHATVCVSACASNRARRCAQCDDCLSALANGRRGRPTHAYIKPIHRGNDNVDSMDIKSVLRQFMLLPAVSGYEKQMAYALKTALAPYADEVMIDRVGNTIAKLQGSDADAPVTMV